MIGIVGHVSFLPHTQKKGSEDSAWSDGTVSPRYWGFYSLPAHEYVVRDSACHNHSLPGLKAGSLPRL